MFGEYPEKERERNDDRDGRPSLSLCWARRADPGNRVELVERAECAVLLSVVEDLLRSHAVMRTTESMSTRSSSVRLRERAFTRART